MEFTKKIVCKVMAHAVLDDEGNFTCTVSASAPYGDGSRSATTSVDDIPKAQADAVKKGLEDIIKGTAERVARRAQMVASQAERVAFEKGELK